MVGAADVMAWCYSEEGSSSVRACGLQATKSVVVDFAGYGKTGTVAFGYNTSVDTLSNVRVISRFLEDVRVLTVLLQPQSST